MESANPKKNPNVYQIGGIPVEFPYKPYGSQLAFMGRVISTLDRAQRQGHCHALLESPTGTGKSLSLLCSALAWQKNYKTKYLSSNVSQSGPNSRPGHGPTSSSGPELNDFASGGGFVPEPSGNLTSGNSEQPPPLTNNKKQKDCMVPTIYYASRTHSQISQVIREYRKTSYRVPMAVLASRKHYCTNKMVCKKANIDDECKLLLKDKDVACHEFKNVHKVKNHPSLHKGGFHEVHDIEDLVKVGQDVKGCSYFAAWSMSTEAQLVFCPYNYIVNPIIRKGMEVDLNGAIVILDEAHNIEDIARDAGSLDVEEEVLDRLLTELGQLCLADSLIYQPLYDMIQGIISWIGQRKDHLQRHEYERYFSCWTGDRALSELQEAGISHQCFPILRECATKAIKAASEAELGEAYLSGMPAATLEGLFSSFSYIFSGESHHALDFQLALQRYVKRDSGHAASGWRHSFSLWCLNPAVVFRDIASLSLSVVLTSGTLSPMSSFASELGVQFESCMEAPHVIDVESQLWAAVISTGRGNYPLNASYKTADGLMFQDALGDSLETICKIVPGGALIFFPSYKLLEKLQNRWVQTGQWARLNAEKQLFVEPRGSQDDFESVLKGYYDSIRGKNRTTGSWKFKRGQKREFKHLIAKDSAQSSTKGGAAFLAVCRGKVSEGIDFSDDNARVVVIVGIPFPNTNDIQVILKKKYNDTYRSSKNLLSGSQWYCHQAFRALNQAAGRCIRHRLDYGAIILLDERFKEERNIVYVSKWLRKSIRQHDNFDKSMEGLQTFFLNAQERFNPKGENVMTAGLENSDVDNKNVPSTKQNIVQKGTAKKNNNKINQHDDHVGRKVVPRRVEQIAKFGQLTHSSSAVRKVGDSFSQLEGQVNVKCGTSIHKHENNTSNQGERNDLKCCLQDSRWLGTVSVASSNNSLNECIEDPTTGDYIVSPGHISTEQNSHSTAAQASSHLSDRQSSHSISSTSSGVHTEGASALIVTPERTVTFDFCNQESEPSFDLSVNSHSKKRRKPVDLQYVSHTEINFSDSSYMESSHSIYNIKRTNNLEDANQGTELDVEASDATDKHQKRNVLKMTTKETSMTLAIPNLDTEKKLHICCSICGNSLGLSQNHFLVACSLTSSSKIYLASLMKSGCISTCSPESLHKNEPRNVQVLVSDISSVDHRLHNRPSELFPQHDIWSEEDGCVFRIVSCPFCTVSGTCLGAQVVATDSSNIHLLNKIFFYADCVKIKTHEDVANKESSTPVNKLNPCQVSNSTTIEKFAYLPQQKTPRGLSTTKSKLRLPRRALLSNSEDQECDT